jgi:hypothetical protein
MPIVYLIDERVSNPRLLLESVPDGDLGFSITSYMSIPQIVTTVIRGLASPTPGGAPGSSASSVRMISSLRIMAHGDSGQLFLGKGVDAQTAVQLTPLAALMRAGAIGRELHELRSNSPLVGTGAEIVDQLGAFAEAGVQRVYLQLLDMSDLDHLAYFATEVVRQLS